MLIGDARVLGSERNHQRDALTTAGVGVNAIYEDQAWLRV